MKEAVMETVSFSSELKRIVHRSGLSLRKIAPASYPQLSRAMNGLTRPERDALFSWCAMLFEQGKITREEIERLLTLEYESALVSDTDHHAIVIIQARNE
jgi:hypothetical protein